MPQVKKGTFDPCARKSSRKLHRGRKKKGIARVMTCCYSRGIVGFKSPLWQLPSAAIICYPLGPLFLISEGTSRNVPLFLELSQKLPLRRQQISFDEFLFTSAIFVF